MAIKCSLLGHRFGETTVEREREEEGTEVVITITEMETCSRCGETRVVSENKEVTTLETPDDAEADPVDADDGDVAPSGDEADDERPDVDASERTDAVILDDTDAESSAQAEARGSETTIPDAESGSSVEADAEDDDAVIIGDDESEADGESAAGDEGDSSTGAEAASGASAGASESDAAGSAGGEGDADDDEREPGEWPDEPDDVDPAERAGETAEVEILGDDGDGSGGDADGAAGDDRPAGPDMDPDPSELAGESAPGDTTEPGSSDDRSQSAGSADGAGAGEWPDEDERTGAGDEAMGDWPEATKRDEPPESNVSGPSLDGEESHSVDVPEGMFVCSECGFTTEADSSSLRAGDFCPECRRGTLLQNEDDRAAEE